MKFVAWLCVGAVVLAGGVVVGDEESDVRIESTAPVDDLRAAVAERSAFDEVRLDFLPTERAIVLRRDGAPFGRRDSVVTQLRELDRALAKAAELRALDDEALRAKFDEACRVPPAAAYYEFQARDAVLFEVLRRGGDAWRDRLKANLEKLETWRADVATKDSFRSWDAHDVELLTVLRRIERKPDPLRVEVEAPEPCAFPELPVVAVRIVLRDERSVTTTRGGDYRSGREGRFHVQAIDAKGRILPSIDWDDSMGGGLQSRERTKTGEAIETSLPLSNYVAALAPGEYRFRVRYADWSHIADPDGDLGVVASSSEPFVVRVTPRVIETTRDEQTRLAALAESLPTKGPVQVFERAYGPWAHEFVPPESAAGRLLVAGWTAVPALARFAARGDADATRRAWAFGLLYDITGRLDPTTRSAIGDYDTRSGGLRGVTGGGLTSSSRSGRGSAIDAGAQDDLARAWTKLASAVELKETK